MYIWAIQFAICRRKLKNRSRCLLFFFYSKCFEKHCRTGFFLYPSKAATANNSCILFCFQNRNKEMRQFFNISIFVTNCKLNGPNIHGPFTYWDNDIPPRIDLGKNKYRGPFTTEDVEDTKAFLRIILLLTTLVGFHLSSNGYQLSRYLMFNDCPSFWILMLVGEPAHLTTLTIVIGIPLYQLARHCCYSQRYFPNMLKRMGFGLLCCTRRLFLK